MLRFYSTVGAGDTFIAGILYSLVCHDNDTNDDQHSRREDCYYWNDREKLTFAVRLATLKVQREGFNGLGAAAAAAAAFASEMRSKVPTS